jgi:serine/threonine protein kinase
MATAFTTPKPGDVVFGYRLLSPLGKGGMGVVYKAQQISLDRTVAVKILNPARLKDPKAWQDFVGEARAAGQLSHPHLVTVHDVHVDQAKGLAMYAMEYMPGDTAGHIVHQRGPMARNLALHITYQIANALAYAHGRGLVHRDVKPDNILVGTDRTAKLLDLGLVRDLMDGHSESGGNRLKLIIIGTPDYAAPEQIRDPSSAVPASDVWALGATLFSLLTGKKPFTGTTFLDLLIGAATDPLEFPDEVPADCRPLIEWMMEKDQDDRPADGAAVMEILEGLAAGRPVRRPTAASARPRRLRRHR